MGLRGSRSRKTLDRLRANSPISREIDYEKNFTALSRAPVKGDLRLLPLLAYHFTITFEQFSLTPSQTVFTLEVNFFENRVGLLSQFFIGVAAIGIVNLQRSGSRHFAGDTLWHF